MDHVSGKTWMNPEAVANALCDALEETNATGCVDCEQFCCLHGHQLVTPLPEYNRFNFSSGYDPYSRIPRS
jgi:hypothetical protein